jgi:hypothetical protein
MYRTVKLWNLMKIVQKYEFSQKLEKRKLEAAATERFEYARKIKGAIGQFSN